MTKTIAIMQRELLSLFYSPIGYIVIAAFLVLTGGLMLFLDAFAPGKPASLRELFVFTPYVLALIIPAISMRAISEEYRSGTIEPLMTAPISDTHVVMGKFLASFAFYVIMLAATLVYLALMWLYGNPDFGATLSSYLGLMLMGSAFTAIGLFASSLTRNQIVAWMVGAIPLMLFVWFGANIVTRVTGVWRDVMQNLNVQRHLEQFTRGLVSLESVVIFLGGTALFLFLTVKVVESRRWR